MTAAPRHSAGRLLAVMESYGSITAEMRRAGLELRAVLLSGSPQVLLLLGSLGRPAAACLVQVIGLGRPLRHWARDGCRGRPIAQETASGILIGALAALADGDARLLLDQALEAAAGGSAEARPLAMHDRRLPAPSDGYRPHPDPAAPGRAVAGGPARQFAQPVRDP